MTMTPSPHPAEAQEREAFEAWIKKDSGDLRTFGSGRDRHYSNSAVNNAWTGWLARASHAPGAASSEAVEVQRLRELAGTVYVGLGAECDLPEAWLDALLAASNGEPFSTEALLPFKANPAAGAEPDGEDEAPDQWRALALQFDGHRMQALGHLRMLLSAPTQHADTVRQFLAAPPLDGETVLTERIWKLAANEREALFEAARKLTPATSERDAGAEPFAYYVYIRDEKRGELVFDLDEAIDDLTNCQCEVVNLYTSTSERDAEDARKWREHCAKLDALITYCPTCCEGFTAKPEMTRDEVIFECGKTVGRSDAQREQSEKRSGEGGK